MDVFLQAIRISEHRMCMDEDLICWFKSTEWTLMNLGMDINSKAVKFYASDAYRKYIIDQTW